MSKNPYDEAASSALEIIDDIRLVCPVVRDALRAVVSAPAPDKATLFETALHRVEFAESLHTDKTADELHEIAQVMRDTCEMLIEPKPCSDPDAEVNLDSGDDMRRLGRDELEEI